MDTTLSHSPSPPAEANLSLERSKCPVFVVGCHRSGTNLLYDTLLSAGGFAIYRGYLPVHKILIPRVGSLNKLENREKALKLWIKSKGFRRSGLDAQKLTDMVLRHCRNGGDFIRITMDEIAKTQNAARWAVYDPDALLHMEHIKKDIPEALFVHIIRDGRDIAVSLNKMGGFMPFFWSRKPASVQATAIYWEWTVRKGRAHGTQFPADYMEIHYEDLVRDPQCTLNALGQFLDHRLDYGRIRQTSLGRVGASNSSFREEPKEKLENPIGRWRNLLSPKEASTLESLIGSSLEEFGYRLTTSPEERKAALWSRLLHFSYPVFLSSKVWLRTRTPVGRFANLSALELESDTVVTQKSEPA